MKIKRWYLDDCTVGILTHGKFRCFTLELPWLDNKKNISCIPAGAYKTQLRTGGNNGRCIRVADVPDRTVIQIHSGNYTRQIEGCILVGDSIKFLDGDNIPDVTNSKNTLNKLMQIFDDELVIE